MVDASHITMNRANKTLAEIFILPAEATSFGTPARLRGLVASASVRTFTSETTPSFLPSFS